MQGVRSTDSSAPLLRNCHLENNSHEGVVAMQQSAVTLVDCVVRDNKGRGTVHALTLFVTVSSYSTWYTIGVVQSFTRS